MFTPIGFFAAGGWTPEEMNGIVHWWRADLGVTLSSGTVTQWTDQIAGKNLTQEGSSTAPDYVSSDSTMNNQAAIEFGNGGTDTDNLSDNANRITPTSTQFPFMWAVFSTADNSEGGYQVPLGDKSTDGSSGQEFLVEFNHPSYANTISIYNYRLDSTSGVTEGAFAPRPNIGWIGIGVDNNDSNHPGYFYLNSHEGRQVWDAGSYYWGEYGSGISFNVGNYGPSGNLEYNGRILEAGYCNEEPTEETIIEFHTYLNERYGTSLPTSFIIKTNLEQWMDVTSADGSEDYALRDASGNGRDLTNNGISWDSSNNWFYLSSNTDYDKGIDTGYRLPDIGGGADWALEMWVRAQDIGPGDASVFGIRTSNYTPNFWEFNMRDELDFGCVLVDTDGDEAGTLNGTVHDDEWVLVNFSNDSSTTTCYITVNGVRQASFDTSDIGTIDKAINVQLLGPRRDSSMYWADAQFGSYRIYSKHFTEAECLHNFNVEKAHFGL